MKTFSQNRIDIKDKIIDFHNKYLSKNAIKDNLINIKSSLETTPREITALAIFWLFVWWIYQWKVESKRAEFIPLAFSEIEQVERNIKNSNDTIGAINIYSLKVNDLCMKIFEAYNESHWYTPYTEDKADKFWARLYECITLKHIYKYNLKDLLEQVPDHIVWVNNTLETYKKVDNKLHPIISDLDETWDDSHHDNYHTEWRSRTVTDSNWKSHTEHYTVQVYDNTTHTYDYNEKYGEKVDKELNILSKDYPTIKLKEKIVKTDKTNAFWEFAADKSRQRLADRLSSEELLEAANSWYNGSTLLNHIHAVDSIYPMLIKKSKERSLIKNSAESDSYKTNSRSDSGPEAFQVIENTLQISNEIDNHIKEVLSVVQETSQKVPLLEKKIDEYIKLWYTYHKTTDEQAEEIMDLTKEIYILNFKTWIDVERFRWWMVFLIALLWGWLGAWLWWIIDYADNKYKLYNKLFWCLYKNDKNK